MIASKKIIDAIRAHVAIDLADPGVSITISKLEKILPDVDREELVSTLVNLDGVKITDPALGGIIIPSEYFR